MSKQQLLYLSRADVEKTAIDMPAIIACGVQGRTNLEALAAVFKIKKAYAYDVLPEVQARFVREMQARFGFEIIGVNDPKQAVNDSTSAGILLKTNGCQWELIIPPTRFGSLAYLVKNNRQILGK